jgi:hypothetical protein
MPLFLTMLARPNGKRPAALTSGIAPRYLYVDLFMRKELRNIQDFGYSCSWNYELWARYQT